MKNKFIILFFLFISINYSQNKDIFVDSSGILRWSDNKKEVRLFGVNYTTPFAYSYRAHKRLGLSIKKSIELDVEHLVRLGIDAYRIHMWDREISDRKGNLLNNEHLQLFDYLIYKLSQKGIKIIITPIAWWGTAWPEPDYETPGFSHIYSKVEMITNKNAREAQKNYLEQIVNHINPYTKLAYKNDPSIIALEIINEPHHPEDTAIVRNYINEMYDALRNAGFQKPIFYNISENWSEAQAQSVCNSKVEGISFQWYPTGLVHNKVLTGNYLINVNKYKIPHEKINGFNAKAKMVYEFDAADIDGSYIYPAMARSFVEAGFQFAAMFSYDPVQIAWSNTEYQTHFINLLYTPSKALSLMIASKVFHYLPYKKSYGDYPQNNVFENFRISYDENLSEINSSKEFIYSNSTKTEPLYPDSLILIAGVGSSPIVSYDGTGAYFFEKLGNGIWKLEVYPDVLWLTDPFQQTSMKKQIAKLFWNERKIKILISELGNNFKVISLVKSENNFNVNGNEFKIKPGVYLLCKKNLKYYQYKKYLRKVSFLDGLFLPKEKNEIAYVINKTPLIISYNDYKKFGFEIASKKVIKEIALYIRKGGWRRFQKLILKNSVRFTYVLQDTLKVLNSGEYEFCITLKIDDKIYTFPDGKEISPDDWDFHHDKLWKVKVLDNNSSLELFNVSNDYSDIIFPQFTKSTKYFVDNKIGSVSNKNALSIDIQSTGEDEFPFGIQINVSKYIKPLIKNLSNYKFILLRARCSDNSDIKLKVNFITNDGKSFQSEIQLSNNWEDKIISLNELKKKACLILPFSYPKFLPKMWINTKQDEQEKLSLHNLEFIQFIIDNDVIKKNNFRCGFQIESLMIQ